MVKEKKVTKKKGSSKIKKVKKNISPKMDSHDWQFFWMLVVIVVIIGTILVSYFWIQSSKSFKYAGVNWTKLEDYDFDVYYTRFPSLTGQNVNYNMYLRNDPRENEVEVIGEVGSFKNGGYLSYSPSANACRGELPRISVDLRTFLTSGLGMKSIEAGISDFDTAVDLELPYVTCNNTERSVFLIDIGEPGIFQDKSNRFCYHINIENCEDNKPIEKFMVEIVNNYTSKRA